MRIDFACIGLLSLAVGLLLVGLTKRTHPGAAGDLPAGVAAHGGLILAGLLVTLFSLSALSPAHPLSATICAPAHHAFATSAPSLFPAYCCFALLPTARASAHALPAHLSLLIPASLVNLSARTSPSAWSSAHRCSSAPAPRAFPFTSCHSTSFILILLPPVLQIRYLSEHRPICFLRTPGSRSSDHRDTQAYDPSSYEASSRPSVTARANTRRVVTGAGHLTPRPGAMRSGARTPGGPGAANLEEAIRMIRAGDAMHGLARQ